MDQRNKCIKLLLWLTLVSMFVHCSGLEILIMTPFGTPSHLHTLKDLGSGLVGKGHQVTIVGSYETKMEPNMTFIHTKTPLQVFSAEFELAPLNNAIWNQYPLFWISFLKTLIHACDILYEKDVILDLTTKRRTYDIIIIDSLMQECVMPVAHKIGAPIVFFTAGSLCPSTCKQLGIPLPFSYVPHFMTSLTSKMTFYERFVNTMSHSLWISMYEWWYYPSINGVTKKYLPESPHVVDIIQNVSVAMATGDGVFAPVRPLMPNFVDVGGIQCRPVKRLPKEFNLIIDQATEGFIVFSLGTWMDGQFFSPDVRKSFMDAFSRLKQVVLWKHNGKEEHLPSNVKLISWLPQQDLLGHPKMKAFITHGGIHGLYEAIYHAVPVIGLGIFVDQKANLLRAESKGFAIVLDEHNITADSVYKAVSTVINEPSYKAAASKLSHLLRDQPQTPMDRALFWVEYVARHNGAQHLQNQGVNLPFYQYFLLDVILVATVVLVVILCLTCALTKYAIKFVLVKCQPKKDKNL